MKLSAYLQETGEPIASFAERAGLTLSTAYRAATGKVMPSPGTMRRIATATDNLVTANDFHDIEAA